MPLSIPKGCNARKARLQDGRRVWLTITSTGRKFICCRTPWKTWRGYSSVRAMRAGYAQAGADRLTDVMRILDELSRSNETPSWRRAA